VAVVNEEMARRVFKETNPVGQCFTFTNGPVRNRTVEVVGVVGDARYASLQQAAPPTVYLPHAQLPVDGMSGEIRTTLEPSLVLPVIRDILQRSPIPLSTSGLGTLDDQIANTIARPRQLAVTGAILGAVALLLGCVGLFGIVFVDVNRRRAEIGIRTALGARRGDVLWLVLRDVVVVVLAGVAVGLTLSRVALRVLETALFGVRSSDPLATALATLVLVVVAATAAYVPARRALAVDPVTAIHTE
jgi:hypothetical protein